MDASEIKLGDVIYLASGGPGMTVEKITASGDFVSTQWFDADDTLHTATFVPDVLTPDNPE